MHDAFYGTSEFIVIYLRFAMVTVSRWIKRKLEMIDDREILLATRGVSACRLRRPMDRPFWEFHSTENTISRINREPREIEVAFKKFLKFGRNRRRRRGRALV